ncbi:biotin transporter BioY [Alkalibacter saccharofermentans]|uniref:Biotin transporter n=1 Tax=Alkalibacter saccharofermentans DSM 14828 TaxID=1120975 RepID=A0A1M4ZIL7_9FIRM|nr:biotin transporter BioY [Alkalibacter saccharofermentans]SHF17416.1 biotin transport system substrate-specific component [Alkalibacter saccharofermentans DSM 14828]
METNRLNARTMIYCAIFSALIIVGALTRVPVPMIPFTLQFMFTNLAGMMLGPIYGALSVTIYVILGLIGLPVFANGGGIGYIFQPTFGYLLAFILAAYVAGKMTRKEENRNLLGYIKASITGLLIVYVLGFVYYYLLASFVLGLNVNPSVLFLHAFLLPLPGDILSCFLGSVLALRVPMVRRSLDTV